MGVSGITANPMLRLKRINIRVVVWRKITTLMKLILIIAVLLTKVLWKGFIAIGVK